tara:strand:+ start:160 stop:411 length:252 start_codon:yes stop_codon:yes gene_type:complete
MKKNSMNQNYQTVLAQIQAIDTQIDKLSKQIQEVKRGFDTKSLPKDVIEEVCLDEVEGNKAALQLMREMCLEVMLDLDPQGEA